MLRIVFVLPFFSYLNTFKLKFSTGYSLKKYLHVASNLITWCFFFHLQNRHCMCAILNHKLLRSFQVIIFIFSYLLPNTLVIFPYTWWLIKRLMQNFTDNINVSFLDFFNNSLLWIFTSNFRKQLCFEILTFILSVNLSLSKIWSGYQYLHKSESFSTI